MIGPELIQMMKDFLEGKTGPNDFSFDFPARLTFVYDEFQKENPKLCDLIEENMPDYCAAFDPYIDDDRELLNEDQLRKKVKGVYEKALVLQ
nr:hypothetical protein [uncultured Caproiciproducens sp.]